MSRWLLRKTSGSRAKYKVKGDYAGRRHAKADDPEHLPMQESMRNGAAHQTYLDTHLVKRWLHTQVGRDFDEVYSEFLSRIQPKYRHNYGDCNFWYTEPRRSVEVDEQGTVWGTFYGRRVELPVGRFKLFYVHPESNLLCELPAPVYPRGPSFTEIIKEAQERSAEEK